MVMTQQMLINLLQERTELQAEVERLKEALLRIRKYGDGSVHKNHGICPYGCDCPDIARQALEEVSDEMLETHSVRHG